jgi:hypothetical protein
MYSEVLSVSVTYAYDSGIYLEEAESCRRGVECSWSVVGGNGIVSKQCMQCRTILKGTWIS